MLMPSKMIDYCEMPESQRAIHKRLENWARWVKPRHHSKCQPMFRQAISKARQWHQPEIQEQVNPLDAADVEKAVAKLPRKHADSLRWWYVERYGERKARQNFGVTAEGLHQMVIDARCMLTNILRM